MQIIYLKTEDITPYANNPRQNQGAIECVANSIREFGFKNPIILDREGVIIAGHTRLEAAKRLKLKEVPCVYADDLTEEQVKAFRLADNKTAEKAEWDADLLELELDGIEELDMSEFGFDTWFDKEDHGRAARQEGNEEYNEFLDKFDPKRTTDDCYTPPKVYDAVANWVADEYKIDRKRFKRPFYPNGDYQKERYSPEDVVVDNPPFSIMAEILKFYQENNVRFFLFAPSLTMFSSSSSSSSFCGICCQVGVRYENGAIVSTSFITNLEDTQLRSAPSLYRAIKKADEETRAETTRELPKYKYPNNVITAPMISYLSHYGIEFSAPREECSHTRKLDSQKEADKQIFGAGFLVSDRLAAEKAAAEKAAAEKAAAEKAAAEKAAAEKAAAIEWELSDRERKIIEELNERHRMETEN